MIERLIHADWSVRPQGRWASEAIRDGGGWRVEPPRPVGALDAFREMLLRHGRDSTVLAGFDVPIGLPTAFGARTGFAGFREALPHLGVSAGWRDFYRPASTAAEIAVTRPFYPAGSGAGTRLTMLLAGLELATADDLLRACERGAPGRKRASPLFWTVGAAQVGRAAAVGWQAVVGPALAEGAALWPFDGSLDRLATRPRLILAETYPADAYAHVGAPFRAGESKRRQADRRNKADAILGWAAARGNDLAACEGVLRDGFGPAPSGEDAFDALLGLLAMVTVANDPGRAMSACQTPAEAAWEGWILGR